jgi:Importin repeat
MRIPHLLGLSESRHGSSDGRSSSGTPGRSTGSTERRGSSFPTVYIPLIQFLLQVRHAALRASVSYLTSSDQHQIAQSLSLMYPMLDTLPSLPHAHLPKFLITLTPLTSSHPQLFAPHLQVLLSFLPALIIPSADSGPTPTVARPYPGTQSFTFPPTQNGGPPDDEELDEEAEEVRKAALEFMISLSEAKPAMVRRVDGWVSAIVRGCLGGMGELRDDELSTWLDADVRGPFSKLASFVPIRLYPFFFTSQRMTQQTTRILTCTSKPWTA